MTKLTNRTALEAAITALSAYESNFHYAGEEAEFTPAEVIEKLNGMITQLDKKAAAPKKPNSTQVANAVLMDEIADTLDHNTDYTVSAIIKAVPTCNLLSNQKVSAVANGMVKLGRMTKTAIKGVTYFRLVDGE